MNLADYFINVDTGYTELNYLQDSEKEEYEFVCFLEAGDSLHDIMLNIQKFEKKMQIKNKENEKPE